MTDFEKWWKSKEGKTIIHDNQWLIVHERAKRIFTAGYKQGVRDEKKRILNGLKKIESNEN